MKTFHEVIDINLLSCICYLAFAILCVLHLQVKATDNIIILLYHTTWRKLLLCEHDITKQEGKMRGWCRPVTQEIIFILLYCVKDKDCHCRNMSLFLLLLSMDLESCFNAMLVHSFLVKWFIIPILSSMNYCCQSNNIMNFLKNEQVCHVNCFRIWLCVMFE